MYGGLFLALAFFMIKNNRLENKNEELIVINKELQSEIEGLKIDTLYLRGAIRETNSLLRAVLITNSKDNPDLLDYFPDINTLK